MITWKKVIDVSEIRGTANIQEIGFTSTNLGGLNGERSQSTEASGSFNWFAGVDQGGGGETSSTPNHPNVFDFEVTRTTDFEFDFPFRGKFYTGLVYSYASGATTNSFRGFDITVDDGAEFTLGASIQDIVINVNTDWSRSTTSLASYELTTLINRTGTTTTEQATTARVTTTTNQQDPTTTTSQVPFTTTRATITNTFELHTWTNTLDYETTFVTGQTTERAFSQFANFVPAFVSNQAPLVLATEISTVTPLTFVEREGVSGLAPFTLTFLTRAETVSATRTVTSVGDTVQGTFPSVTTGGSKITSSTQERESTSVEADDFGEQAAKTIETIAVFNSLLSHVAFAGVSQSAYQSQSYTQQINDPDAYLSSISYTEGGALFYSETIFESAALRETGFFKLQPIGELSVAHSIGVAVRALPDGPGGASYEQVAQGNNFSRNTMTGVIPVTGEKTEDDSSYSFSGNSYTFQVGTNPTSSSVFTVEGQSTSQWTLNVSPSVTMAGGPIAGDIFISYGHYETHDSSSSGSTRVESVLAQTWEANAPTTAWRTVQAWQTSSFASPVSALTRHNITDQPIDD
jgi:hypothetical protein